MSARRVAPTAERTAISRVRAAERGEQQVRDVRARNQKHASHRAQQHQQRRPDLRGGVLVERPRLIVQTSSYAAG
jgi:hypothetical protein